MTATQTHEERHEDFVLGCPECLDEAWDGGAKFAVERWLPGAELRRMPNASDTHAVGEVWYGGERLFVVTYEAGTGKGVQLSEGAAGTVEGLLGRLGQDLDEAIAAFGAWSKEAGDARYRFLQVQRWSVPEMEATA